jgi:predicted lipid-binding transport protein (Tim44 family)
MDEFARVQAATEGEPWGVPPGFDTAGFLENAKAYFRKLQTAWDRGDLKELEEFTTQEMFAALTHELRARATGPGTEVLRLEAALLGIETSATEYLASVRFSGTLVADGETEVVDEVWNLGKPIDGSSGWLLAGIQQLS